MSSLDALAWEDFPQDAPVAELDGMHLWAVQISDENAVCQSADEASRSQAITDEKTRVNQAAAQGGLRRVLAAYCGEAPQDIVIARAVHGKPYVERGPEFNLSHTRHQIFVIVSKHAVGLDIEAVDRPVRAVELAQKFFNPEDQRMFAGLSEGAASALFLRLWVCKEAMVKLSGDGVYHGLRDARVILADGEIVGGEYRGRTVHLSTFQPAAGFLAAVASWQKEHVKCFFRL